MRDAVSVFLDVPIESEGDGEGEGESVPLSVAQAWERIELLVTREELAKAIVELGELLPEGTDEDADTAWRKQLLEQYATVRPFTSLLAEVIPWGATQAGTPIVGGQNWNTRETCRKALADCELTAATAPGCPREWALR